MDEAVRDVLDNQVIDRNGKKIGKVDGIVMEVEEGKQPRITCVEMGTVTLAHRISTRFGSWMKRLQDWIGINRHDPYRIPWSKIRRVGLEIQADLEVEKTPLNAWSEWLKQRVIKRIPGA